MEKVSDILCCYDAIIVVDVQNDFCPQGALPIKDGDKVVDPLNKWISAADAKAIPIYISRDWHPINHLSFKQYGGLWPVHCVQDTDGARFHPRLIIPNTAVKVTKGIRFDKDQNSAFDETGLAVQLRKEGVKRVFVGGLAEDVCVLATLLDAVKEGFEAYLIADATMPVTREGGQTARKKMKEAGIKFIETCPSADT